MPLSFTPAKFTKSVTVIFACFVLAACADEVLNEPNELQDIEKAFSVDSQWTRVIGDGDGDKFNSLQAAIWEDKIVTSDVKGLVTAYDKESGKILWEKELNQPVSGGVTINAGLIAVGTKNASVIILDVKDGNLLWQAEVSSEVLAKPAIDQDKVVVRTADGRIFGFDIVTGKQQWFYDRVIPNLTLRGTSAPVAIGGIVVSGFANGKIATFNIQTGDLLWEQRISVPRGSSDIARVVDVDATPVIYGDNLYAAGYNGFAIALDLRNGRFLWREKASVIKEPVVDSRYVYLTNIDGSITALDRTNGQQVWKQDALLHRGVTSAADNETYIIVGDFEGYLHWLDKSTGKIVARKNVGSYGIAYAPLVTENMIYAATRFGYLHALKNPRYKEFE